eukprot:m.26728 g.26728  ORF g.26728 m.26728 type:complete len:348 (-) comp13377_c0_seq3:1318-2361(-)
MRMAPPGTVHGSSREQPHMRCTPSRSGHWRFVRSRKRNFFPPRVPKVAVTMPSTTSSETSPPSTSPCSAPGSVWTAVPRMPSTSSPQKPAPALTCGYPLPCRMPSLKQRSRDGVVRPRLRLRQPRALFRGNLLHMEATHSSRTTRRRWIPRRAPTGRHSLQPCRTPWASPCTPKCSLPPPTLAFSAHWASPVLGFHPCASVPCCCTSTTSTFPCTRFSKAPPCTRRSSATSWQPNACAHTTPFDLARTASPRSPDQTVLFAWSMRRFMLDSTGLNRPLPPAAELDSKNVLRPFGSSNNHAQSYTLHTCVQFLVILKRESVVCTAAAGAGANAFGVAMRHRLDLIRYK